MKPATEGMLTNQGISETAATVGNRLYGDTGSIDYTVRMQTAMGGLIATVVNASSGDLAAAKALDEYPGAKVVHIEPAPRKADAKAA